MPTPRKATTLHQPASRLREFFVEKYSQLLSWTIRLTHGDREQAEDLLHEAFVQFTLRQLDFTGVENIEGYLYTVLKHFHRAKLRQAKRDPLNQLSLAEFDSVELALRSTLGEDQVDVQNDLRRVCAFLCWRKAGAKSASYLILRFFHGYYPEEIARIARTTRNVVHHGLLQASSETKVCLTDPGRLRFMPGSTKEKLQDGSSAATPKSMPDAVPVLFALPTVEFLHDLNEIILSSRVDECLPREELLRLYRQPAATQETAPAIGRTLLAHLVSCPPCLDTVNHLLQMPPLSDRFPGDRLGKYRRDPGKDRRSAVRRTPKGTGSQMSYERLLQEMQLDKDSILKIAQYRQRECFEHQPKKIFVAVNGEIVATQDVSSDHNKQSVRLDHRKAVDFVDVFSEQGIRLAFISVIRTPPEGPDTLSQRVELSAGRSLEATLEFTSSGPLIEVAYTDPLGSQSVEPLEAEIDRSLGLIADPGSSIETSPETPAPKAEPWVFSARKRWSEWVNHRLIQLIQWIDTFHPLVISGAIAVLAAVVIGLYFARVHYKAQEARTLLAAAAQQESRPVANGHVIHRVLEFEVVSQDSKQASQHDTIDIWKSADNNRLAMRWAAQDGKLLAGVWKTADGAYSIYRDHKLVDHSAAPKNLLGTVTPENSENLWMDEPSANAFQELAAKQGTVMVQKSGDDSIIDYRPAVQPANANRPHLVRASLTLRADRHVIGQTFWIESSGEVRRYSYREVSYEERPAEASDSGVFSPDRNLTGRHTSVRSGGGLPLPGHAAFLAHLNLEAFTLLNSVNADSGERIAVSRTPSQHLNIRGVLESNERLAKVKAALAPLASDPLVDISLISAEQQSQQAPSAGRHTARTTAITIHSYEINAQSIPAQQRLKVYFSRRGHSGKDLDRQIEMFSQDTLGHSSRALQQAWTLHTLASSFSVHDWQQMSLNDHKQWIALYLRHSAALQDETQAIRQSLDVLSVSASGEAPEAGDSTTDNTPLPTPGQVSLTALTDQLLEQISAADRILRSVLTASTGPPPDLDALSNQLRAALALAARIRRRLNIAATL